MNSENIYGKMSELEIQKLIQFSPSNLKDFFDNSIHSFDRDVPTFG
jgi:hypothetical protein